MSGLQIVADANMRGVEAIFSPYGSIRYVEGRGLRRHDIQGADVLLVRSVTVVDSELLRDSGVQFVGTATSGLEHVDQRYLAEQGLHFAHAQGSNANAVVEYVLAAIAASGDTLEQLLSGASLGIVGQGHVGSALAACARGLGFNVLVHDPWLPELPDNAPLEAVLDCTVVSLHAELTRQAPWPSFHLLDEATLSHMTGCRLLVNASRGAVIDNRALLARLRQPEHPACVLDVWEHEPGFSRELLALVDLGTPHVAGYSLDAKLAATRILGVAMAEAFDLVPPPPGAGTPPAPLLTVGSASNDAGWLRQLLPARYDIRADDQALRDATLGQGREQAAAAFDALRRNYPERRELRDSPVHAPALPAHIAEALGLRLVEAPAEGAP